MTEIAPTPAEVVQRQLEAYNRRDRDAFLATFHDEAKGFGLGADAPSFAGKAAIASAIRSCCSRR